MYSLLPSFITTFVLIVGAQPYATLGETPSVPGTPTPVTSAMDPPPTMPFSTPPEDGKEEYKPGWCNVLLEEPIRKLRGQCPFAFHEFPCKRTEPATDPLGGTDVRHLRPEDIKIAMAIGDSMTAGFGMESWTMPFIPFEFRGKSFSVGGDDRSYTVFNFLKRYNKDLLGGSTGSTWLFSNGKDLNRAKSGSHAKDLPGQIDRLIKALQRNTYNLVRDDWKMLTILIGPNDICTDVCHKEKGMDWSVKSVEKGVRDALEKARLGINRMHVNLVGNFKFAGLRHPQDNSQYCRLVRAVARFCKCESHKEEVRDQMNEAVDRYNAIFAQIANDYKDKYDDFNVVYQPAFVNLPLESYELQLLSSFDCYHPNDCGGHAMAFGLWNNMWMAPEHKYTTVSTNNQTFMCPDGNMYLR